MGGELRRLPLVLGEAGQSLFLEERSCKPRGEWELLDARMGEGFQGSGLLSGLRRRNQVSRLSGWPLGHILSLRQIQEGRAPAGLLQGKHSSFGKREVQAEEPEMEKLPSPLPSVRLPEV